MKNVLIASFDMDVGGVERSLISMLNNFDYDNYKVDLMLYSHSGDFMSLIPKQVNLLKENKKYKTYRLSIAETIKKGHLGIGIMRLLARYKALNIKSKMRLKESGYIQMQYMWKYALPILPKLNDEYDVAISYLWPHYFIAEKVKAKTKIAWIHTDYSEIATDIEIDLYMWNKFDYIISISQGVTDAFLTKYPTLKEKIVLIENITSPEFIKKMAKQEQNEIIIDEQYFNVLSVGRICYAKGFDNAIKALKRLHIKGFKNIRWYIVGYGEDEQLLKNLIKENDLEKYFILLGKKTNPYPYIEVCDLYVQPSRYEGKAVTVTEAKILGKPIIITNYPTSNSQIVNGEDGYITEQSIEGIVEGIEKLYLDKVYKQKLEDNCRNTDYSNAYELDKLYKVIENTKGVLI